MLGNTSNVNNSIKTRALDARRAVSAAGTLQQQSKAAENALAELAADTVDPVERELMRVAIDTRAAVRMDASKVVIAQAALDALSTGVSGSIGGTLAGLGVAVLKGEVPDQDRVKVGQKLLAEVGGDGADEAARAMSEMATTTIHRLDTNAAKAAVAHAMLASLASGVTGSLGGILAGVGTQALSGIESQELKNQAVAGAQFLHALGKKGSPDEQKISNAALAAYAGCDSHAARKSVAAAALAELEKAPRPVGQRLAFAGAEAIGRLDGGDVKNRANVGQQFLESVSQSGSADEAAIADVALSACDGVTNYDVRAAIAQVALTAMAGSTDAPLAARLAQIGATALRAVKADELVNRAHVASSFVTAVRDRGTDALGQQAAEALRKADESTGYDAKAHVLGEFLSATGESAPAIDVPPAPALDAPPATVATEAPKPPALDAAGKTALEKLHGEVVAGFKDEWGKAQDEALAKVLREKTLPAPAELAAPLFEATWPAWQKRINEAVEGSEAVKALPIEHRTESFGEAAMKKWAEAEPAPLRFGETFVDPKITPHPISGADDKDKAARTTLIDKMLKVQLPADDRDEDLLRRALDALPTPLLQSLDNAKYTFVVTRDRISNVARNLEGRLNALGELADMDEGTVVAPLVNGETPRVVLRSHWENGALKLDPDTFLREVGRAVDRTTYGPPSRSNGTLVQAFNTEHAALPTRYHKNEDFAAEMFARYHLDPQRCKRQFPATFMALDAGVLGKHKIDLKHLVEMEKTPAPAVNVTGDPVGELKKLEELNKIQGAKGLPALPYRFEIQGEREHNVDALITHLGRTLREARNPEVPRWRPNEGAVRIPAATFNDATALEKLLVEQAQSGRGAFLVLDELPQIKTDSPGFAILSKYVERFGGQTPLLMLGSAGDLDRLREALPTAVQKRFSTQPLTADMVTELADQRALTEGYELSAEAKTALRGKARDGELKQMYSLWNSVKTAQIDRTESMVAYLKRTPEGVRRVLATDVASAKASRDKDPMEELERMTGLGNAKRELKAVLAQVRLQKQQVEHGMTADRPRLNLLFEGNPGTGKTTVAKLFADALTRVGYLKNNKFVEVRVQDLIGNRKPEENVKKLFEENKGGVIFIDEMHQLKDTPEGRLALRAMIPYLGHPEYADTVFIGAGYKGEMLDLIRDVDAGAERRFTSVPFDDYSGEELGLILDKMAIDKQRTLDDDTRKAALMRLQRERRRMKNFGNAGSVQSILEGAIKKQTTRLVEKEGEISKAELMALAPDDFAGEKSITPAEVWAEIDALQGLDELKAGLRELCASIEYDRETGADPLENFEPYFILDGPPGTGKNTMARLIVKLMAAYDIIPDHAVVESQGADLQAGFVGQTTTKVEKLFESMWGRGGFIDEIGGLARAVEAFKADATKTMLKQMEDNRGRFILVVADYADRINEFLDIDPGLARRFGQRYSLEPLPVDRATASTQGQLEKKGLRLSDEVKALVARRMEELHEAPNWASNGDVRLLVNKILRQQKVVHIAARRAGETRDPHELQSVAVDRAFDSMMKEKLAKGKTESSVDKLRRLLQG